MRNGPQQGPNPWPGPKPDRSIRLPSAVWKTNVAWSHTRPLSEAPRPLNTLPVSSGSRVAFEATEGGSIPSAGTGHRRRSPTGRGRAFRTRVCVGSNPTVGTRTAPSWWNRNTRRSEKPRPRGHEGSSPSDGTENEWGVALPRRWVARAAPRCPMSRCRFAAGSPPSRLCDPRGQRVLS